ncbi:MAG TPA: hypothetical protein VLT87_17630 [Thermoanaerobaculia bacterium]|nr:hypothetical protein [Thermoanaerobaculia bacterium]
MKVAGPLAGLVVFHVLLTLLDFLGIPWHPVLLVALLLGLCGLAWRFLPRPLQGPRLPSDLGWGWGWGDGIALFALAGFTLLALTSWIAIPDFFYHWGVKGERFAAARGIDYVFLARPWNWAIHPDYPNLLPELYAATALLFGKFSEPGMMLWSGVFFALLLAGARSALRQAGVERFSLQAGMALLALVLGAFGIGHLMAGAADWMIALAVMAAVPPLLRPPDPEGDLAVAFAAAFAAASKIEGVPLAGLLVLVQFVRHVAAERRVPWLAALRLGIPVAAVVLPWLFQAMRHGLLQSTNSGAFEASRAALIGPALRETVTLATWHGFGWTVLLPLPLLFFRKVRPVAAVTALLLLFDLYVYFTAPVDTRFYVLSSFPRLMFQVIPAILVAAIVATEPSGKTPGKSERPAG